EPWNVGELRPLLKFCLRPSVFMTCHDLCRNLRNASVAVHPNNVRVARPCGQQRGFVTKFPYSPVNNFRLVVRPLARDHSLPDNILWRLEHHYEGFGQLLVLQHPIECLRLPCTSGGAVLDETFTKV